MSELDSGVAKASLAAAQQVLDAQLAAEGSDAGRTGEDLFAVTSLLDSSVGLRRALTDPSREAGAKAAFVRATFTGKISPAAVETLVSLASARWTAGRDLSDATERLAVGAVVTQAERSGHLDALEDELFRFSRTIAGNPSLRDALADRTAPDANRASLVSRLLLDRAVPETIQLARRVAVAPRGLRAERVLEDWVEVVAQRREQLVAHVVSASALSDAQRDRLAASLSRQYGRPIRINVDVDPHLVGGLRVSIGDDVIDGSILARLEDARRRLAG
ncbi:F0F1 ATP synthase subunit delta [Kineococcus rhizosphaerae]|uniref:ATP synthase subunit delta n=1 Tax=Kineococcus rhizosphaerae TaxID=559628 RepID=A0A2T0QZ05_9ACTN|nr:F0F1 ATP synthase subunit delta [Kineococcus rhizosphaerae]PRY11758.1 ATP synthase F1 subcomplex delta subunit [Kineococcus rhizosphaerae]